jgi:hypothetical protein
MSSNVKVIAYNDWLDKLSTISVICKALAKNEEHFLELITSKGFVVKDKDLVLKRYWYEEQS